MDKMKILKITLAIIQPLLWWLIHAALQPVSVRANSEIGLEMGCTFSALVAMAYLLIPKKFLD